MLKRIGMPEKDFRGVIAMLVTPMDANENIDFVALRREIDWCAMQGVKGIVVTPSIGEFACLSMDERLRCFEICFDQALRHPRLFTIATIAATNTREVLRYAEIARSIGYDAAQLVPPYYWLPDEEEVYRHYAMAAEVGLPIVVYHNPALSKFHMSRAFMGKLASIPGVIAIKEVKTDRHVDLEPLFRVINGKVKIFTTFRVFTTGLTLGSSGGFINVFAVPACIRMWRLYHDDGEIKKAEKIQVALNEVFPRGGETNQKHIGTTKMIASVVTGIPMGPPRSPYSLPDQKFEKDLRRKLPDLFEIMTGE